MAIITTPGAGVSPYEPTTTAPTVLRAGADGSTVLATPAAAAATVSELAAANANTLVVVSGQAALNSLITSNQPGVFEGANVTINLEEQNFNTTNQVTATTNYPSGNTGEIQYNSGANSFASDAYFTYTNSNVITPGIRTNNYLYANGAPFLAGGNAAIGNFVFTGDNMTIAHANSTLNINGNGTGNVNVTANGNTWTFGSTGILTLPGGPRIVPVGANIELQAAAGGYAEIVTSDGNNYVAVTGSDAQIVTSGINTWTFDNVGNLILPGNTFAVKYANGDTVAISTGGFPLANGTSNIDIATANGNVTVGVSGNTWTFDNTGALIFPSNAEITSDMTGAAVFQHEGGVTIAETNGNSLVYNSVLELFDNAIHIGTDRQGNAYSWNFSQDGSMTVPGNISGANVITANVFTALSNVNITSSGNTWTFDTAGVLTVPGEGIINSIDDTVTLRSSNTSTGNANSVYLGTSGGLGFSDQSIGANWLEIFRSGIDPQLGTTGNLLITTDSSNTATTWTFDNQGNLTLPGSLIVPANSIITGVGASPAPSINGFNNIDAIAFSASGNVTANNLAATNLVINSITSDDSTVVTIEDGLNVIGDVDLSGNLVFSPTQVQSSAYAGGNGHMMMIDTNRTDTYVEIGSADKPFKTFSAAIAAVALENPTGTVPYTFVLAGCTINETVDFTPYNFNFITISTTCRSVFNDPVIFGNSALLQLTIRNVEFGDTVAITGDGTANQFNNTSIYNVSFVGALTVTAVNAIAFYEAAFFAPVVFNNVSYCYVNGGQFNDDWTIRVDDTGAYPIPSGGIAPGVVLALDFIANDINFVKGGTGVGVFQPHSSRMGRTGQTYALPASWILTSYSSAFLGTWTNDGTWTMRNSVNVVTIANTAPTYSGTIGGTTITATGNITGGNLTLSSTTGNIIGHDITLGGTVSATGNVTANNGMFTNIVNVASHTGAVVSVSGNVTGGNISAAGLVKTGSFVTGTIPAAAGAGAGARAFVTDADSITFGNLYVGGSSNAMPVWSNGTNWYIG